MRFRSTLIFACLSAAHAASQGADKLIPIDAFVERQQFSQPRLSPDGKHVALNVRIKRGDRVVPTMTVYSLPDLNIVSTIALTGFEIPVNFGWLNNHRLVVQKGLELEDRERPAATGEVVAVDLDGSKPLYLYGYKNFKLSPRGERYGDDYGYGAITQIPEAGDGHLFIGSHQWDGHHSMLYDINSNNSVRKLLADIPMENMGFVLQNDSKPRFSFGRNDDNEPVLLRLDDADGEWKKVDKARLGTGFHPFAFTADNLSVYASQSINGAPYQIVREVMSSGERSTIAKDATGNIDILEYTARPEQPFAFSTTIGIPKARYLESTSPDAKLHKLLSEQFPDAYVHFINFSDDGKKLLFSVRSDRDPGSFYLFDRGAGKADLLFTNMPQIEPEEMAERRPILFAARDGLQVAGYLTLPKNPSKKKLPMVLLPHGGPFADGDEWFFDTDAQFLASRGYAVLQVNFRGTEGRGVKFRESGYREWGGKMLNDLIDGVKWANTQPEIDANRVCVFGISFGGYAALMLPVREPGMFKCSVGHSGRYNMASKYQQEGIKGDTKSTNFLIKTMGDDPALLASSSPTNNADKIKIPVLLVHGKKDKTTALDQAEDMRDALVKAGNPPEWMLVAKEDHGFYHPENHKAFYERLEVFLAKHLGK
ncbi:MAG: S9 family peptidase [Pseudomonadota bacterium]